MAQQQGKGEGGGGPDWLGLLKWSLKYQDGTADRHLGPLADEKRRWLEQAMQEVFVDIPDRLKEVIKELDSIAGDDGKLERASQLWEEVLEQTEHLDYALIFCQLGGLPVLSRYMASDTEAACLPALSVLSTITQNNPRVQVEVLRTHDPVPRLCSLAEAPGSSDKLVAKAVQALSCTVRGIPAVEDAFVERYGPALFAAVLARPEARARQRALFFLQALLSADEAAPARGQRLVGLMPAVVALLEHEEAAIRGLAQRAVAEMSDLIGHEGLMAGEVGEELRRAMIARRGEMAGLQGSDREEAADEVHFWDVLEAGGRFRRQEPVPEPPAPQAVPPEAPQEGAEEEPAPVLLLEPAKLSGANVAP